MLDQQSDSIQKYQRRIDRERTARKEAERLLEEKSAALYEKNLELFSLSESLEKLVAQRTSQMQKARDDALAALKVKTDFIANMSHELRTPLNGVLGVLTLMKNEALTDEQEDLLRVAESSGKHLLGVINDILDFSKIEANKISIELAPLEIRPYIKQTIAPFALEGKDKGIKVLSEVENEVEQALNTDQLRLTQIITNLLSNALKFTHEGEVKLSMSKLPNGAYRIAVSDTGIGISQENVKTVFAAFEQADTSITREFGGTGLGMSITQHLVNMLGGKVHLESELGRGTTFYVDIHMQVAQISLTESVDPSELIADGKKLLLVEDHKVNQMVAKRLLESWGFEIVIAENGLEATELAKAESFDAVLMDLQMPIMGGVEATKKLRQQRLIADTVPIIAMTAHSSQEHVSECMQAGMQDHVSKPLNKDRLLLVLSKHLGAEIDAPRSAPQVPEHIATIHIAHVDIEASLERVGNDWPLLHGLIKRFLNELADFHIMFSQIKADDMQQMGVSLLHKIKGSGSNLGMIRLAEMASEHEHALLETGEWPSDEAIAQISTMIVQINDDFTRLTLPSDIPNSQAKVKVDIDRLKQQIASVKTSITQDVFAAEAGLQELMNYELAPELATVVNAAGSAMQNFHTEAVIHALNQAQQMLE